MLKALVLILLGNNLAFSLLLDNFTDPNDLNLGYGSITKGSDFAGKLTRVFPSTHNWSFLPNGGISFSNQRTPHEIGYLFYNSIKYSDIENIKTTFHRLPFNNLHRLTFYDSNNVYRCLNTSFISSSNVQTLFLKNSRFYDSGTFDENDVSCIFFSFNSSGDHPNDCILDSIEIVPEPFSIITLGSGLIKLVQRKGRK